MPIPPNAVAYKQMMDPSDVLDFNINLAQTIADTTFLQPSEAVTTFSLVATVEAVAAGLQIKTGGQYDPSITGTIIRFWLQIAPGQRDSAIFLGTGVSLAIEVTVTTDSVPPRVKQRTLIVSVAQQ